MTIIAYIRVSAGGKDIDSQYQAILAFAQQHELKIDTVIQSQMAAGRRHTIHGVDPLWEHCTPGDTVMVSELSRLGHTLAQVIQTVDHLLQRRIHFVAVKENLQIAGTHAPHPQGIGTLWKLLAALAHDFVSERTREGMARAAAAGKRLGRPHGARGKSKLDGREEEIRTCLAQQVSRAALAKSLGVARSTLQHFLRSRHLVS
jgi:DNA invertase Pin-like site-specific DNA recombinase